jgi:Domain of unknown function (DUF4259)
MGTWGAGLFDSDTAQDVFDELREATIEARLDQVTRILEHTAADPSVVMRENVPEEIVVAAAIVAATMPTTPSSDWVTDAALQEVIAGMQPQTTMAAKARSALQAAMDYHDSWLISSLKDENDRQFALRQLNELKAALGADV